MKYLGDSIEWTSFFYKTSALSIHLKLKNLRKILFCCFYQICSMQMPDKFPPYSKDMSQATAHEAEPRSEDEQPPEGSEEAHDED